MELNSKQLGAVAQTFIQFTEEFELTEMQVQKCRCLAEKFRKGKYTEVDIRLAQYLGDVEECMLSGMRKISQRVAYDTMDDEFGAPDEISEDPTEAFILVLDEIEDVMANTGLNEHAQRYTVNERFEFIEILTEIVLKRGISGLVVTGSGGLGKSYTVFDVIGDAEDVKVTKGYSSPRALFDSLCESPNALHVFDDCDSILEDRDAVNLLKGAIDTGNRIVSWNTFKDDTDPFEFTGSIIFISNKKLKDIPQPILSRCHFVDVTMTADEKIERMEYILENIDIDMDLEERKEVLGLMSQWRNDIDDLNVRTFLKAGAVKSAGHECWKDIASYQMLTKVE